MELLVVGGGAIAWGRGVAMVRLGFSVFVAGAILTYRDGEAFAPCTEVTSRSARIVSLGAESPKSSSDLAASVPADASGPTTMTKKKLGLLTFDLDDTLFPIGPVVSEANAAMVRTMARLGYDDATSLGVSSHSKQIRKEITSPITYTELRKRSIQRELRRCRGPSPHPNGGGDDALHESVVDFVFDAWLTERHASAERRLFPETLPALAAVKESHPDACVAAVTNGRGDPLAMDKTLRRYFDFVVSGEDEGVFPSRKPERGIFDAALARYEEWREKSASSSFDRVSEREGDDDEVAWVHVGDDLANDVGASASCGAIAIWLDAEGDGEGTATPSWSTATPQELQRRKVLANSARTAVGARISTLDGLPDALMQILGGG